MGDNNSEQFNVVGNEKKKKQMGPVAGILVALIIAIIIIAIGLLIRMVVSNDGDYFKPFKTMFGIEKDDDDDEEDDEKQDDDETKSSKNAKKSEKVVEKKKFSSDRYTLLSDDVEDEDVKHYRLTVDVGEIVKPLLAESTSSSSSKSTSKSNSNSNSKKESTSKSNSTSNSKKKSTSTDDLEDFMDMYTELLPQMGDMIDGEMYVDIYFEGNEIVQLVIGYDYGELLDKFYEYAKEESKEELEEEGIESVDDFAEFIVDSLDEYLDEDALYDMLAETSGFEETLKAMGIKEKDVKEAIEFCNEEGVIEVYIYGTTKLKGLFSMVLDSKDFQDSFKDMEKETGVKLDKDNVIESIIKAANKSDDFKEAGFKFVEVD